MDAGGQAFVRMLEGVVRLIEGDPIAPGDAPLEPLGCARRAGRGGGRAGLPVLHRVAGARGGAAHGQRSPVGDARASGARCRWPRRAMCSKSMCTPMPPRPSLPMRPGGGGWRGPRPTTCGRSTGAWLIRDAGPLRWSRDTSADLSDAVLDRHRIALVPLQVTFGAESFRDRVELRPEEFYRRLRAARGAADHLAARSGRVRADPAGRAGRGGGGGCGAAGRESVGHLRVGAGGGPRGGHRGVHLVDSRSASLGLGMLALRAAELAEAGRPGSEVVRELERVRGRSGMLLTVDRFDHLLRSGRVSRGKAWIGGMLDVKPILTLDETGRVVPLDRVRGREQTLPRVLELAGSASHSAPDRGTLRGGPYGGPRGGGTGPEGAGDGLSAPGLFREPRDRRPGHPRGPRRLGDILSGRGVVTP